MWDEDWERLGIAPTTELAAIKKAYALKLRVTRPDDDAAAYQALRGAYERVQLWVKWQAQAQQQGAAEPTEIPTSPAADASATAEMPAPVALVEPTAVDALPAAATPAESPAETPLEPEHVVQPRHLIDELELRWRRSGEPALMSGWEEARRELDQQPLARQAEFSTAFAQWVLGLNLPDEFLKAVNDHFGWLDDFRTERQLGPALAHALQETLEGRLRPRPLDPAVRALAAPLLGLQALRGSARGLWLTLLFFVLQPLVARNAGLLGPRWMREAGLDPEAQRWLDGRVKRGLWMRIVLVSALMFLACFGQFEDLVIATGHTATWFTAAGLLMVGGMIGGALVNHGPFLTSAKGERMALPLDRWRRHRSQPWRSLTSLLIAAGLAWMDAFVPDVAPTQGWMSWLPTWAYGAAALAFAVDGVVLGWPLNPLNGCVAGGLVALLGYFAENALGAWLPLPACLLVGAAVLLLAAAVFEERVPGPAPVQWAVRPLLNTFTLAGRWTYSVALSPLAVCVAWAVLNDGKVAPIRIFLVWVLSILAIGWLQGKADAWGLRQLPGQDAG